MKTKSNNVEDFINNVLMIDRPVEDTIDLYSEWADTYDKDSADTNWKGPDALVSCFVELDIPKGVKILDVCCGTGKVGWLLKEAGYANIDGLDGCAQLLSKAKLRNVYGSLWQALIKPNESLPVPEKAYDVALMSGAACPGHVSVDSYRQIIRAVKPGGLFGWIKEDSEFHEGSREFSDSYYERQLKIYTENSLWQSVDGYFPKKVPSFTLDRGGEVYFARLC